MRNGVSRKCPLIKTAYNINITELSGKDFRQLQSIFNSVTTKRVTPLRGCAPSSDRHSTTRWVKQAPPQARDSTQIELLHLTPQVYPAFTCRFKRGHLFSSHDF